MAYRPFNSLSRDHLNELEATSKVVGTFNSLSRDHAAHPFRGQLVRTGLTFNSLSRDHGITVRVTTKELKDGSLDFQLPLSGSLSGLSPQFLCYLP